MRPLLIGQAPKTWEQLAAFAGDGPSARRLSALLDLDDTARLLDVVDAVNLSPTPLETAPQATWRALAADLDLSGRVVVACGRVAATALQAPEEWFSWRHRSDLPAMVTSIPHPSGLTRAWNDTDTQLMGSLTLLTALELAAQPVWREAETTCTT